jgi:hypothetical protein
MLCTEKYLTLLRENKVTGTIFQQTNYTSTGKNA